MTPDERLAEIEADLPHVHRPDGVWLVEQLRDARAEVERLRESTTELAHAKAKIDNLLRDNHDLCRTIADLRSDLHAANTTVDETFREAEAELAAERAKVERVRALCDEARRCAVQPDACEQHREVTVAQIRVALAGGEQDE